MCTAAKGQLSTKVQPVKMPTPPSMPQYVPAPTNDTNRTGEGHTHDGEISTVSARGSHLCVRGATMGIKMCLDLQVAVKVHPVNTAVDPGRHEHTQRPTR